MPAGELVDGLVEEPGDELLPDDPDDDPDDDPAADPDDDESPPEPELAVAGDSDLVPLDGRDDPDEPDRLSFL